MKKKSIIILASVVVICAVGLLCSQLFNWPVDSNNASGNIAKSSRFSRKTADAGMTNMQELIQNDENYKKNVVTAYYVMQTRAQQFGALVDMSNEAAGGIKEFEGVLKNMNETKPMIDNVCAAMVEAGNNLNMTLSGEPCEELAESVTNSALAYTTLQKQNKLADDFIEVADKYLAKNSGSDELKFVRDQWLNYQQSSAVLNKDEKASSELSKKGYQLSSEQTMAMLADFPFETVNEVSVIDGIVLSHEMEVDNPLADIPFDSLNNLFLGMDVNDNFLNNDEQKIGYDIQRISNDEQKIGNDVQKIGNDVNTMGFKALNMEVGDVVQNGLTIKNDVNDVIQSFGNMGNDVQKIGHDVNDNN